MKRYIAIFCLAGLICFGANAQTDVDLGTELGGRLAVSVDKKLARGLHVSLKEEIRFDNNFAAFDRFHTTVGVSYKVNDYLKVGAGYAWILPYSTTDSTFKSSRHRLMVDVTGGVRVGDWRFSLRERFQATVRTGSFNAYQNPGTLLALKSRLKVQYKGLRRMEPYASLELRNTLNAPSINASYNGTYYVFYDEETDSYSRSGEVGWFLDGFNKVYLNRLRGVLGVEYRLSKASTVDVSLMGDYVMDLVVDANAEGTKLKSYTRETGFVGWLTVGYKYAF